MTQKKSIFFKSDVQEGRREAAQGLLVRVHIAKEAGDILSKLLKNNIHRLSFLRSGSKIPRSPSPTLRRASPPAGRGRPRERR